MPVFRIRDLGAFSSNHNEVLFIGFFEVQSLIYIALRPPLAFYYKIITAFVRPYSLCPASAFADVSNYAGINHINHVVNLVMKLLTRVKWDGNCQTICGISSAFALGFCFAPR